MKRGNWFGESHFQKLVGSSESDRLLGQDRPLNGSR